MDATFSQASVTLPLQLEGSDAVGCDLPPFSPGDGGRVLSVTLHLSGVLPDRQVAAAIALEELDEAGNAFPRGLRTLLLPPQPGPGRAEVEGPAVRFVLPAELDLNPDGPRRLVLRADAHYVERGESSLLP